MVDIQISMVIIDIVIVISVMVIMDITMVIVVLVFMDIVAVNCCSYRCC